MSKFPPIYYADYLQLESLLNSQKPKSTEYGYKAHDEMLLMKKASALPYLGCTGLLKSRSC